MSHQQRPESKSGVSFRSKKSHKSNESQSSVHSPEKKTATPVLHTKADPTLAMSEAEPAVLAQTQENSLESLRGQTWRDSHGNVIAEPDRSNPTRSRWERPLDTIRSFEAAIEGSQRKSVPRADSSDGMNGMYSRRNSSHQGLNNYNSGRYSQDAGYYYGNRAGSRPDSFGGDGYGTPYAGPSRSPRYGQRMNSDPMLAKYNSGQGVYPTHGYQQSYDTVTTGASGSSQMTEPWGNSTDPSSENSSIDRMQTSSKSDVGDAFGFGGFAGSPPISDSGFNSYPYAGSPPASPPKNLPADPATSQNTTPRPVIKLGGSTNSSGTITTTGKQAASSKVSSPKEDRPKSWLKKRFSRG
ncbi:hypothetical protein L228DRAFT_264419 [Xylona heveae TC161]|uniref:DUF2406 domain-containing protein n=1 Tax=Xylona heveae (strain CBS 132557 / TC161) TaxID=1328760 RepID=A0A165JAS4_XYLHT|nr:hypothetical protein L228DRAFT_264419 [Xylona heveae TC161]KZF25984.1 hypothetical protein L228DRAFT_264419 [Xylona heveae TC161]